MTVRGIQHLLFALKCISREKLKQVMGIHAYSHIATHTSSSSLPSFRPHSSAGDPALTWLTKIPVLFPPTIVISSARLARLCFGEVGVLEIGELWGIL